MSIEPTPEPANLILDAVESAEAIPDPLAGLVEQTAAYPLAWLQNNRRCIVVLKRQFTFGRLRDVSRIAVSEPLLQTYRRHMRPLHMPKLAVLPRVKGMMA